MKIYTKQEWFTPAEVAIHNKPSDCWVSLNGKVFDLSPWLQDQFKLCHCTKSCSCEIKNWYCDDDCVEYCPCFKRGFLYCDAKRSYLKVSGDTIVDGNAYLNNYKNRDYPFNCMASYIIQLAMTIVAYAGKDVSHWFKGEEWKRYIHPIVGSSTTYQQHGHGYRQPVVPSTRWRPLQQPWWLDEGAVVGKATAKTRPIRITNTLTGSTVTLEVCSEETLFQVMMRYLPHNSHMMSYTWRYLGKPLCYNKTLAQNGIPDERDRFSDVALAENIHIPAILIYYNDDLTEDPPRHDCFCQDQTCLLENPEKCYHV